MQTIRTTQNPDLSQRTVERVWIGFCLSDFDGRLVHYRNGNACTEYEEDLRL